MAGSSIVGDTAGRCQQLVLLGGAVLFTALAALLGAYLALEARSGGSAPVALTRSEGINLGYYRLLRPGSKPGTVLGEEPEGAACVVQDEATYGGIPACP